MHDEDSTREKGSGAVASAGALSAAIAPIAGSAGGYDWAALARRLKDWGRELGFSGVGIAGIDVSAAIPAFQRWLELGRHGSMDYMARNVGLRCAPETLLPGLRSVISVSLPYWPSAAECEQALTDGSLGYISRYALGRDYHKTLRRRLQKLAERLRDEIEQAAVGDEIREHFAARAFADSAPVLEVEFSRLAGIGWRGKHSLSLTREGSWRFLGELYTTLPLPPDAPVAEHCGDCRRCLDACPTDAIVAPYEVDARRCISYLTIELHGAIPPELRPLIGARIYGCDDCQIACPWNRFARLGDADFAVRHALDAPPLVELFAWSESDFDARLAGSPIRRIGHQRWLRNIAVALGNAPLSAATPQIVAALQTRADDPSPLLREHVAWALAQQAQRVAGGPCPPSAVRQ
ncbi:tRNA epoxyqueuosine(34) reductase QueG [Rhodocyclus tenuis]|uniref:Epoxyqueuosine reductase n=1 Tax=Rhodocyclus tenuis TaxID=1066 RepID=A0A840GDW1_RHOTE|nr:tRNA epoxyqueuosine(34) reductase QueG [Rhodocyclus tenuis]MBB4246752.1 epoxyqueuosine reductase [Rhodocyclus tenuis]